MVDVPRRDPLLDPTNPEHNARRLRNVVDGFNVRGDRGGSKWAQPVGTVDRQRAGARSIGGRAAVVTGEKHKVDVFDVADDTVDTFDLSHPPSPDSWNVTLNGLDLLDEDEFMISGTTLAIVDPVDTFRGADVQGTPWKLRAQYDYRVKGKPADFVDSWTISSNKASSTLVTDVPYLDVGSVVTSAEVTVSGVLTDCAVGLHKSIGNYICAQYEEVGTHQVRILPTRNGVDEALGSSAPLDTQTAMSLSAGDVLKLTANWTTGAVSLQVNGSTVLSGTMSPAQLAAFHNPNAVCLRSPGYVGSLFDGLKADGVVVDNFNRADADTLGTSSSGSVWAQE